MKTRCKITLIKRNKKQNYKIFIHESYSNISGYEEYFVVTDYNEIFIKKMLTFKQVEDIFLKQFKH